MNRRGITLIEMLVVVTLVAILAGITFPSVSSGVDSLRLSAATDSTASFINAALNRAERRQQIVELTISKAENTLTMRSTEPGFVRTLAMPEGVTIHAVHPRFEDEPTNAPRQVMLFPGGTVPRFGVEFANRRGARRIVLVDPVSGAPVVERPVQQ